MNCVICAEDTDLDQVCDNDRRRGHRTLATITHHYTLLRAPDPTPDRRLYAVRDDHGHKTGERRHNDPIASLIPAGLTKSGTGAPVTGSREAPLPLSVDSLDLTLPTRQGVVRDSYVVKIVVAETAVTVRHTTWHKGFPLAPGYRRQGIPQVTVETRAFRERRIARDETGRPMMVPAGDQDGNLSVASVLDEWVRSWRERRAKGEGMPVPTVPSLVRWLSDRWEWACDEHPAVADFMVEIGQISGALKAATKDCAQYPELCQGVACGRPDCDERNLYRVDGWVECFSCRTLYSAEEYADLVHNQAKTIKMRRAA